MAEKICMTACGYLLIFPEVKVFAYQLSVTDSISHQGLPPGASNALQVSYLTQKLPYPYTSRIRRNSNKR